MVSTVFTFMKVNRTRLPAYITVPSPQSEGKKREERGRKSDRGRGGRPVNQIIFSHAT